MLKSELIERAAHFRSAGDDPTRNLSACPALVLNADYTPLSYYPLSLWPWQTAIKAVFLERVDVVESYSREVHSPSWSMPIPSVIALRQGSTRSRRLFMRHGTARTITLPFLRISPYRALLLRVSRVESFMGVNLCGKSPLTTPPGGFRLTGR